MLAHSQPPGQAYSHDGEQVNSGRKFLFRSDVMYRRRGAAVPGAREAAEDRLAQSD
jgi:hypothetical protein